MILGYLVLDETMTIRGLVGCALVIAAVVILTLESAVEKKKA